MNTAANIIEIFEKTAKKCISLQSGINGSTNSYDFEQTFRKEMAILSHSVYQEPAGGVPTGKNERMQLMTSVGKISIKKGHPLAVSPGGFKISAYLQEQMCRSGSKMTFEVCYRHAIRSSHGKRSNSAGCFIIRTDLNQYPIIGI
jgi:hypothetical protein